MQIGTVLWAKTVLRNHLGNTDGRVVAAAGNFPWTVLCEHQSCGKRRLCYYRKYYGQNSVGVRESLG